MIVPDASVIIELLLRSPSAVEIEGLLLDSRESLHAPHLLDVEVAQVVRRYAARGEVNAVRGRTMLGLLAGFPISRYSHQPMLERIWALRTNLTAYDAAYVALAEALDATLVTCDAHLARASGHRAKVQLIGE